MIVLKEIEKALGKKIVLKNLSFHIAFGEKVGIIGLNGAGKTTLMNVISGILKPDKGFIRVNGVESPMEHHHALRNIAYISGTRPQLWKDLKIKDSYEHCQKMYQIDKETAKCRLNALDEIFEVKPFLTAVPNSLSLGERMRCELVYGLLAEPEILMLDEALIGLDVSIKHKIMGYFEQCRMEKKSTMLFTSHNLLEVEKLCDRVILLDKGEIIFDGSIKRMMKEFAPLYRIEVKFEGNLPDFEDLPLEKFYYEHGVLEVVFDKQKIETTQLIKHIMEKCTVKDVKIKEPDLEDTIKKIYNGRKRS
ncbi:MAG: ATP-binding cassette domain-containing protein [Lachnospiraceae bacterium]|nr:ATP-binding cassette domain-containing protein [Lachnospiraceae bacterium]